MKFQFQLPKFEELKPVFGLEGPYRINQAVVYFDSLKNQYWDPCTDHYLADDEVIHFIDGKLSIQKL